MQRRRFMFRAWVAHGAAARQSMTWRIAGCMRRRCQKMEDRGVDGKEFAEACIMLQRASVRK